MPLIFDIKRFALHDGPGIRTTVFLKGCPLKCIWCHNPESHSAKAEVFTMTRIIDGREIRFRSSYGEEVSGDALLNEVLKDRKFYEESDGGVTFSGGEPLLQHEELSGILKTLGEYGIHRAVDTTGHAKQEFLKEVAAHTDLFLYDLKLMDAELHKKYTGVDNHLILTNADFLLDHGYDVVFRIPLVPGINDSESELDAFLDYFTARKGKFKEIHLLPYHKIGSHKYDRLAKAYNLGEIEEPEGALMQELKTKFEACGAHISIGG